jgi:hypothetical protein
VISFFEGQPLKDSHDSQRYRAERQNACEQRQGLFESGPPTLFLARVPNYQADKCKPRGQYAEPIPHLKARAPRSRLAFSTISKYSSRNMRLNRASSSLKSATGQTKFQFSAIFIHRGALQPRAANDVGERKPAR